MDEIKIIICKHVIIQEGTMTANVYKIRSTEN